ncbi:MAG: GNAT family N-acetyltransferase [Candidatus Eremiobacteraeota bacterium]|nr:GNAT family N-acetyltransferase [Candidatus Eremiobacteraeota bacterium]
MEPLTLARPSLELKDRYLAAMEELPPELRDNATLYLCLTSGDLRRDFPAYLRRLEALASPGERVLVPAVEYWALAEGDFVGRISLRLHLNGNLSRLGGHIGYEVRPSARTRGYATQMLRLCLLEARRLGLMRVLLTCDETNSASRRVIEKNGGEEIPSLPGGSGAPRKLRFYISTVDHSREVEEAVSQSLSYLGSGKVMDDLGRDPYWPKWTAPWWHMMALHEAGLSHRIPRPAISAMSERLSSHYLHHFPLTEEEIPAGADPYRHIICHCAMGTMARLLREEEGEFPARAPWVREWIERYQMADGGFNCDEGAYTRPRPVSSIESTLPMLELLLTLVRLDGIPFIEHLERGCEYLMAHRLARSARSGRILNSSWLGPLFPRFYNYDILRGLQLVAECSASLGFPGNIESLDEHLETVERWFSGESAGALRNYREGQSLLPAGDGSWGPGHSMTFPLLDALSAGQEGLKYLACQWRRTMWLTGRLPSYEEGGNAPSLK